MTWKEKQIKIVIKEMLDLDVEDQEQNNFDVAKPRKTQQRN